MFVPRFSLRRFFGFMLICILIFWIASFAVRGQEWALAVTAVIGIAGAMFAVFAILFLIQWVFWLLIASRRGPDIQSPFAEDRQAPQIVRPETPWE